MAHIIGGLATSHVPSIGAAIAKGETETPYWKPFFDAFKPVHAWLEHTRPDIAVVLYNDHGLNFFLNNMPTFALGAAATYENADEGWGIPVLPPFTGEPRLSWHLADALVEHEFDIATCQEMLVDHAFTLPMKLMFPDAGDCWPVKVVPVSINSVQHPLPSPHRCWKLGKTIGAAIRSWRSDAKVMMVATGGLSHQLDGTRAGFINADFDRFCLNSIVDRPEALALLSTAEIIEKAGSQGVELMTWIAMRGVLPVKVRQVSRTYHVPVSNTGGAVMLLDATSQTSENRERLAPGVDA
jgi:protocatechuate 4,5-dioxygenase beta chain